MRIKSGDAEQQLSFRLPLWLRNRFLVQIKSEGMDVDQVMLLLVTGYLTSCRPSTAQAQPLPCTKNGLFPELERFCDSLAEELVLRGITCKGAA